MLTFFLLNMLSLIRVCLFMTFAAMCINRFKRCGTWKLI